MDVFNNVNITLHELLRLENVAWRLNQEGLLHLSNTSYHYAFK